MRIETLEKLHTYLARGIPWSRRRCLQDEACTLHSVWADSCDYPKSGWLERIIFGSGDKRSRCPFPNKLKKMHHQRNNTEAAFNILPWLVHFYRNHFLKEARIILTSRGGDTAGGFKVAQALQSLVSVVLISPCHICAIVTYVLKYFLGLVKQFSRRE